MDKKWIFEGEEVCTETGIRICLNEGKLKVISDDLKEEAHFDENGKFATKLPYKTEEQRVSENKQRVFNNFFCKIGEAERKLIGKYLSEAQIPTIDIGIAEENFLTKVQWALQCTEHDFWISIIECSIKEDKLVFERDADCTTFALSVNEWNVKAKEFAPEFNSRIAFEQELILFYAYRLAKGYWTLSYICTDSSGDGNYENAPRYSGKGDLSCAKKVGGFNDGVGNTRKIVMHTHAYAHVFGGTYRNLGWLKPVAQSELVESNDLKLRESVPVIVCTDVKGDLIIQK